MECFEEAFVVLCKGILLFPTEGSQILVNGDNRKTDMFYDWYLGRNC